MKYEPVGEKLRRAHVDLESVLSGARSFNTTESARSSDFVLLPLNKQLVAEGYGKREPIIDRFSVRLRCFKVRTDPADESEAQKLSYGLLGEL
eukprot:273900-Amphidinium_carterae.1